MAYSQANAPQGMPDCAEQDLGKRCDSCYAANLVSGEYVMSAWLNVDECQPHFSNSYSAARDAWLKMITAVCHMAKHLPVEHYQQHIYPHPLSSPDDRPLATDSFWLGCPDATQVIVVLSGTHGIEGYAGSAIQHMLLSQILHSPEHMPPESTAFLFVHALTPWGFAWYRRCDEHGIDLNRHFVKFDEPLPTNPDYEKVRPWLFEVNADKRNRGLATLAAELGRRDYEIALSGGQYRDPLGPFYGGTEPNHGHKVTEDLFQRYALPQRDLIVLDLHTGLGPWGYGELICDHPPGSAGAAQAKRLFGAGITEPALGTSSSVPKTGLADYAWHEIMNNNSCYLTLEFGTHSTDALFNSLIEDHQLWAKHRPTGMDDELWIAHRHRLLEHFCPADPWWRHSVLQRARQVVDQALSGLRS